MSDLKNRRFTSFWASTLAPYLWQRLPMTTRTSEHVLRALKKGANIATPRLEKNRPSNHRSSWEGGGGFPEIFQNELVSRSKGVRRRRLNNNKKTVKKQRRNDRMNSLPQSTGMGRQRQQQQATPTTMTNSRRVGPVADRQ